MPKWLKWEFWPYWFFYIPVYFKWIYLGIKARSLIFFSAANPLMEMGGFASYSKFDVLEKVPQQYKPKTFIIEGENPVDQVKDILSKENISYPIILKPDIGERGLGVAKVKNEDEVFSYFENATDQIILQEYVPFSIELGVMYHRVPTKPQGEITSIVVKDFLTVVGDGKSTLKKLFASHHRTRYYYDMLCVDFKYELDTVLVLGEKKELVSIGNHCKGTTFLDGNHLINDRLLAVFDEISSQIEGFYFGRYDLRVKSLDDLYKGKNIKIMELNGANSEPAHIYDPNMSLFKAYKALFAHWSNLYEVSKANHKNGIEYMSLRQGILKLQAHIAYRN